MPQHIQIPPEGKSKIVQLYIDDNAILRAGSINDFHGNILGKTLKEFGVPYKEITLSGGRKGPERGGDDKRYKLVGAGFCSREEKILYLDLDSDSLDYHVGINREHLERCRPFFEEMGFKLKLLKL